MSRFNTNGTDLVCLTCGNVDTIQRKKSRLKEVGHIKTLYCYSCMKRTKHYEVVDVSTFVYNNIYRENLDADCDKALNFLLKREECRNEREDRVFGKILTRR